MEGNIEEKKITESVSSDLKQSDALLISRMPDRGLTSFRKPKVAVKNDEILEPVSNAKLLFLDDMNQKTEAKTSRSNTMKKASSNLALHDEKGSHSPQALLDKLNNFIERKSKQVDKQNNSGELQPPPNPTPHNFLKAPSKLYGNAKNVWKIGMLDVHKTIQSQREKKKASKDVEKSKPSQKDVSAKEATRYPWEIDPKKLEIKKFLAKGTYGSVHRGTYNGQDVAVKLLDWGEEDAMSRAELTEIREAFNYEVSVWSTLDHPNVTKFIGALTGEAEGFHIPSTAVGHDGHILVEGHVCCLVLEYLPGGTLKDLLVSHMQKKLPYKTVIQLAHDIASGLAYLHSKHIVHRDVKSDNMLLDKHKNVKIADFGVSRVETEGSSEMEMLAGTFGYMAPEVLRGIHYDHKVDVYSFGILLWEMYCCDNPFPFFDFNIKDVKSFVNQGLRPGIPTCCPADLASLMKRCWDADPIKRPEMEEAVGLLEEMGKKNGVGMLPDNFDLVSSKVGCFNLFKHHHHPQQQQQ